jgi:hypothetical protein
VVAVYSGNDYLDLIRRDDRPYLTQDPDGAFTEHPPYFLVYADPRSKASLLESSRVYQFGKAALGPSLLYQVSRVEIALSESRHHQSRIR